MNMQVFKTLDECKQFIELIGHTWCDLTERTMINKQVIERGNYTIFLDELGLLD